MRCLHSLTFFSSCGVEDARSRLYSRVQPGDRKLLTGARNIFSLVEQTAAAVAKCFLTVLNPRNINSCSSVQFVPTARRGRLGTMRTWEFSSTSETKITAAAAAAAAAVEAPGL